LSIESGKEIEWVAAIGGMEPICAGKSSEGYIGCSYIINIELNRYSDNQVDGLFAPEISPKRDCSSPSFCGIACAGYLLMQGEQNREF
jgi:hypothetical protein